MKKTLQLSNGMSIPVVGFGCYQIKTSEPFYWALKHGYRHLDSAVGYGNEKLIGKEVRRAFNDFGLKRENLFLTTKIPPSH
jgi:L-glyceraldehyde reductase